MRSSDLKFIVVDGAEHLLVRVDATGQGRVVANQLQRWNRRQSCKHAGLGLKLDQEVDFHRVDNCANVFNVRKHDGRSTTLFNLQDI